MSTPSDEKSVKTTEGRNPFIKLILPAVFLVLVFILVIIVYRRMKKQTSTIPDEPAPAPPRSRRVLAVSPGTVSAIKSVTSGLRA